MKPRHRSATGPVRLGPQALSGDLTFSVASGPDLTFCVATEKVRSPARLPPRWRLAVPDSLNNDGLSSRGVPWSPGLSRMEVTPSHPRVASQWGEAVVHDGDHVVVYGTRGDSHDVVAVRFVAADVARGDLSLPERRCGGRWATGCAPTALFSPGAPEFSVHHDDALGAWVWLASGGFGAAPIVWRTAPAPEGPWSDPTVVFRPPEATRDGAFVYAGKAHPELDPGPEGGLVVTYVPSGFDDVPTSLDGVYYRPYFARVWPR
jgi:hypothetical protein